MKNEDALILGYTKTEWSWIFQDWANSAYSIVITTAIFPLFYKAITERAGIPDASSTAYLSYANAIATALVALSAPILGSMADYRGYRNKLFTAATLIGVLAVLFMAFIPSGLANSSWLILLLLYVLSSIGFGAANVFYDASLLDVTTRSRMSKVSSMGFGMGYIGSCIPFILVIVLIILEPSLPVDLNTIIRFSFVLTAIWWFGFTIPYWKNVEQLTAIEPENNPIGKSFKRLKQTLQSISQYKNVGLFLIAYFLYIDGVGTIIKMATSVGADLGLDATVMIVVLLIVQIVAFPFTILYGKLADRFGEKKIIYLGITTYIIICIFAYFMQSSTDFFILAFLVGTAQGGLQSLSRSMFGKLIPATKSNEFFGFYNVFGKFSSIIGTTLLGVITQATGNSLNGVFGLIVLFIIGGIILLKVEQPSSEDV